MSKNFTPSNYSYEDDLVSAFFGLLLFIISVCALYMVCANFSEQSTTDATTEYQPNQENIHMDSPWLDSDSERSYTLPAERKLVNTATRALSLNGIKEVGEPISFSIEHFSPVAQYRIDFGDGRLHQVTQQDVVHTYNRPDTYHVKVQIEYEGQIKTISKETVNIYPAIEMKASIAEVEF